MRVGVNVYAFRHANDQESGTLNNCLSHVDEERRLCQLEDTLPQSRDFSVGAAEGRAADRIVVDPHHENSAQMVREANNGTSQLTLCVRAASRALFLEIENFAL